MKRISNITADRLRELIDYDPETGIFRWRIPRGGNRVGDIAGCPDSHNYHLIGIDRKVYVAHRLAWLWMTGCWPEDDIDHVNRDKKDNRWANLREATRSQNIINSPPRKDSRSGLRGISWDGARSKWVSQIGVAGKNIHLGRFKTKEEAYQAYKDAAIAAYGEFAEFPL